MSIDSDTGPGLGSVPDAAGAEIAAHWRAMSPTRLLDCGMDYGDVLTLWHQTGRGARWDAAAEALADAQLRRAQNLERSGHTVSALEAYRAAIADLVFAQMAFNFDVERKHQLYDRLAATAAHAAALATPAWEKLELPFADSWLRGWLVRPPAGDAVGTVVVFGGQSGWGVAYLRLADALNRRGMAAILAEGPGQGESRLTAGVYLDADVAAAYCTFVDHALDRPELGGAVGLWGNSLGGLYAALAAARDPRVSACCVNGAPAAPHLLKFRAFREQAAAMLGTEDPSRIQANFDRLCFEPDRHHIDGPVLVLHGGNDPIVTLDEQRPFLAASTHSASRLQVFDDGEHTIYNHAGERNALIADWFASQFTADDDRHGSAHVVDPAAEGAHR